MKLYVHCNFIMFLSFTDGFTVFLLQKTSMHEAIKTPNACTGVTLVHSAKESRLFFFSQINVIVTHACN